MGSLPLEALFLFGSAARTEEAESAEEEKEVWIVEMMTSIRWNMTWSEQAEAWVEEEEAGIVASPARPSPVGP